MNVMDNRATSALLYLDGVHVSFDGFHAINDPKRFDGTAWYAGGILLIGELVK